MVFNNFILKPGARMCRSSGKTLGIQITEPMIIELLQNLGNRRWIAKVIEGKARGGYYYADGMMDDIAQPTCIKKGVEITITEGSWFGIIPNKPSVFGTDIESYDSKSELNIDRNILIMSLS